MTLYSLGSAPNEHVTSHIRQRLVEETLELEKAIPLGLYGRTRLQLHVGRLLNCGWLLFNILSAAFVELTFAHATPRPFSRCIVHPANINLCDSKTTNNCG